MSYQLSGVWVLTKGGHEVNINATATHVEVRDDEGLLLWAFWLDQVTVGDLATTFDPGTIETIREFCGF
jgi:hypothetical protein